jgi:hypothetical protein
LLEQKMKNAKAGEIRERSINAGEVHVSKDYI